MVRSLGGTLSNEGSWGSRGGSAVGAKAVRCDGSMGGANAQRDVRC